MAAPYRKKSSILEMSDREIEARRQAKMRRPGKDAIEQIAPEFSVLMPARGAAKAMQQSIARKQAKTAEAIKDIRLVSKAARDEEDRFLRSLPAKELERARKRTLEEAKKRYDEVARDDAKKAVKGSYIGSITNLESKVIADELDKKRNNTAYNKGGVAKKRK